MNTKDKIIKEINDIPESELPKIFKMIHFFKVEILTTKKSDDNNIEKAIKAVEESNGIFHIDRNLLTYLAEDKEIEYEY